MILLDTHAWVWWTSEPEKLSTAAVRTIRKHERLGELRIAAISVWEVAKLVSHGRLAFTMDIDEWIHKALQYAGIRLVPLTPDVAIRSTRLMGTPPVDPADQMIIATAIQEKCAIISKDRRIQDYPYVQTIWGS